MRLKELRIEKNMTVQQLADAAGLSKRTVEDILRRGDCLVSNALKLAQALGVSIQQLCDDSKLPDIAKDAAEKTAHCLSETQTDQSQ